VSSSNKDYDDGDDDDKLIMHAASSPYITLSVLNARTQAYFV